MTKLEEEIYKAMISANGTMAKAAAEVAKKYIEKAIEDFGGCGCCSKYERSDVNTWLKENGITE